MSYTTERRLAIAAVTRACNLCRAVQQGLVADDTVTKRDRSPVTVADFGSQAVVNHVLREGLPGDAVLSEEDAGQLRDPANAAVRERVVDHVRRVLGACSADEVLALIDHCGPSDARRLWALDPIDGTKGFLRREQFAVALGLVENGRVVLGVLGCPNLPCDPADPRSGTGCLFIAARGGGTVMRRLDDGRETPVRVSGVTDPAAVVFCESVESAHTAHSWSGRVAEELGVRAEPLRMDSQCKYAAVARGDATAYLRLPTRPDYEERLWDHAAGLVVVTEAGGTVTDINGAALDVTAGPTLARNRGVVASNSAVHQALLDAIAAARGS